MPQAGAIVFGYCTSSPTYGPTITARTDEQARFRMVGLKSGQIKVSAWAPSLATDRDTSVTASVGQEAAVTLHLMTRVAVQGTILAGDRPLAGAYIEIGRARTRSGDDGA